jgi:hypothetical protein
MKNNDALKTASRRESYGEHCSHCSTTLEATAANDEVALCGRCGCIFSDGDVMAFRYSNVREPACLIGIREISAVT